MSISVLEAQRTLRSCKVCISVSSVIEGEGGVSSSDISVGEKQRSAEPTGKA